MTDYKKLFRRTLGLIPLTLMVGLGIGWLLWKRPLEKIIHDLPAFAKHDIAHDWCTQSAKARDLCASWRIEPMDSKGK